MANVKDWLNQKFTEWEQSQGHKQSYYAFARYLEVSQSGLAQWMTGSAVPGAEDLAAIAGKLGADIYDFMGLPRPSTEMQRFTLSFASLPADIRLHMMSAIVEAGAELRQARLRPESPDARQKVIEILDKWGFQFNG